MFDNVHFTNRTDVFGIHSPKYMAPFINKSTEKRANFEILMPEVDSRYTTICSVDGWGEINNNKFVVITPMVITK